MSYSHKTQIELQKQLGPKLRELFCLLLKGRKAAVATIEQYARPNYSINMVDISDMASLLNLDIPVTQTRGVAGFFRRGIVSNDNAPPVNPNGKIKIPANTVFFHEIMLRGGHFHMNRKDYPMTIGGGKCGFNVFAQLFKYWKDNKSIPETALGDASDDDKKQMQILFNTIKQTGKEIVSSFENSPDIEHDIEALAKQFGRPGSIC
jgi:hypothetical protein